MKKIFNNIDELRKIVKEENFKEEEALEFIDAIESEVADMDNIIEELELNVKINEEKVSELELELENALNNEDEIKCGIGTIKFSADNLLLQNLMDNLRDAIQSSNPLEVLRNLEKFSKNKLPV